MKKKKEEERVKREKEDTLFYVWGSLCKPKTSTYSVLAPNIKVPSRCGGGGGGGRGSSTYPLEVGIRPGWWTPSSHRSETHYSCWYLVNKSHAGGAEQTLDASGLEDSKNRQTLEE